MKPMAKSMKKDMDAMMDKMENGDMDKMRGQKKTGWPTAKNYPRAIKVRKGT